MSQTFQEIHSAAIAVGTVGYDDQTSVNVNAFAGIVENHRSALVNYLETYVQREAANRLVQTMTDEVVSGTVQFRLSDEKRFRVLIKRTLDEAILEHFQLLESARATQKMAASSDGLFVEFWRQSVLQEAWSLLNQLEGGEGFQLLICRLRFEFPLITMEQLMRKIEPHFSVGSPEEFRMQMRESHQVFLNALFRATQRTLKTPSPKTIYQEIVDLRLDQLI